MPGAVGLIRKTSSEYHCYVEPNKNETRLVKSKQATIERKQSKSTTIAGVTCNYSNYLKLQELLFVSTNESIIGHVKRRDDIENI